MGHLDRTPIGTAAHVVLVDPLAREPLPVAFVDPLCLVANPLHPPLLDDDRYRAGREEMRTHGVVVPLTALTDGFLLDGHRRLAAALELGLAEVPVCYLSGSQARALVATYSRRERREMKRYAHWRLMLARVTRLHP